MIWKLIKNSKGFSIIEAVVAMGILGVASYGVLEGLDQINSSKTKAVNQMNLEVTLSAIVDEVRSNIAREKIDFKAYENFINLSNYEEVRESLYMRWNKSGVMTQDACSSCKGRIGYVVTPYKVGSLTYKGLYEITIRVTHDELFQNRFKQFNFIVRGP